MQLKRLLELSDITDADELRNELVERANEMGFGLVMAAVVVEVPGAEASVTRFGNTPDEFLNASVNADDSARDPVLQRLKRLSVPVIYDQALYARECAGDLWELQAPFGYRTGIAVALHLSGGKHVMLGLDRDAPLPKSEPKLIRMLGDMQLLVVHAQEPALRLFSPSGQGLSPRQRTVLQMTGEGCSAKVIARSLGLTEAAVNFHLQKAFRKLGVTSKHLAVRKAEALGLL